MSAPAPVFLLTDFGARDAYAGQVRAVLAALAPGAPVLDLTHEVTPFAIEEGAWLLETALPVLPAPSVVLAVVDPGVGGARAPVAVRAPAGDGGARCFVGPDNGLLSAVAPDDARPDHPAARPLPAGVEARRIESPRARRATVSATFHGRDLFAPAAALVAREGGIGAVGPALAALTLLPPFMGVPDGEGGLRGTVVHVDRYGNLITSVRAEQLPSAFTLEAGGHRIERLVRTFGDVPAGTLACHVDSSGFLAIAEREGSAAVRTGLRCGDGVRLSPRRAR